MSIPQFIKKVENTYNRNVERIKEKYKKKGITLNKKGKNPENSSDDETIFIALLQAESVWKHVQITAATTENYGELSQDEKMEIISKKFKGFSEEFPIVSRYMVCFGQYKMNALEKMLQKMKHSAFNVEGESNEDIWIQRQADYVRYLWEECQTKRFQREESNQVWQTTYDALKKEFKDFKQLHKDSEQRIKDEDKKFKAELIKEAATRVISGTQQCDEEKLRRLVYIMKNRLYKQQFDEVLEKLKETVPQIPGNKPTYGTNKEAEEAYQRELKTFNAKKGTKIPINGM